METPETYHTNSYIPNKHRQTIWELRWGAVESLATLVPINRDAGSRVVFALNVMHYYKYSYIIYVWNIYVGITVYIYYICIYKHINATCSYSLDSLASHTANLSLHSLHTLPERQEIYTQSLESDWNIRDEGSFSHLHCFRLSFGRIQPRRVRMGQRQMRVRSDAVMHKKLERVGEENENDQPSLGEMFISLKVWKRSDCMATVLIGWLLGKWTGLHLVLVLKADVCSR